MGTPLPQKAAEAVNTAANPTFATKSAHHVTCCDAALRPESEVERTSWVKISVEFFPANGGRNAATARLSRSFSFLTIRE